MMQFLSERLFTFFSSLKMFNHKRLTRALVCGLLMGAVFCNCQKTGPEKKSTPGQSSKKWDRKQTELEYQLLRAELMLAKLEQPYLVVDLKRRELRLKLQGATVWNQPINVVETDSQELENFADGFSRGEGELVRFLSAKHLFSAEDRTPDSVLAIVGQLAEVDPELLQRDVPGRFELIWGYGLILEVRTDVIGRPKSQLKNTLIKFRRLLKCPFGQADIIVKMTPEGAITLYRACRPGLATLVYPPV